MNSSEDAFRIDAFAIFWLGGVAIAAVVSLVWAIYALRRGEARLSWTGERYDREEEPFYFWMTVLGHVGAFIVCCFMFWFGLDMLNWSSGG